MDRADIAIEQWARERPDLSVLPMYIFWRLLDAAESVMRDHMNPLFAEAGLLPGDKIVKIDELHFHRFNSTPLETEVTWKRRETR